MRSSLLMVTLLGAALAYGTGCGDGGGTGGTGGTGGSTGGTGGSHNHTGGSSTGGSATGGSATGGSSTGGSATGGSATGGSGGSMSNLINGCDPATAEDHTNEATATIAQVGFAYDPPCITIKAGSSVKFTAAFASHPLVGGTAEGVTKTPDPNSPIQMTSSGTEATFTFDAAGTFPFYCNFHAPSMAGAIFVVE